MTDPLDLRCYLLHLPKKKSENTNDNTIVIMKDDEEEVDSEKDDNEDVDYDLKGHCIFCQYTPCLSNKLNQDQFQLGKVLKQDGAKNK